MKIGNTISSFLATTVLAISAFGAQVPTSNPNLEKDVRHAINSLAYYGVFDDLNFTVGDGGVVTLSGQVMQYYVHNSAVTAVRTIPGVTRVVDQIETVKGRILGVVLNQMLFTVGLSFTTVGTIKVKKNGTKQVKRLGMSFNIGLMS